MADQQGNRPLTVPSWATNTNLSDAGESWDATPSKVDPGTGVRENGWNPDADVDAQHINYLFNELGRWVQHFSDFQITNWRSSPWDDLSENSNGDVLSSGSGNGAQAMTYDDGSDSWWISLDDGATGGRAYQSYDGVNWEAPVALTTVPTYAFSKPTAASPATTGDYTCWIRAGSGAYVIRAGTASTITLSSLATPYCGCYFNGLLLIAGQDSGATALNSVDPTTLTATARTVTAGGASTAILDVAASDTLAVALGSDSAGEIWTSTDGTTWTNRAPTLNGTATNVVYNDDLSLFMLVTNANGIYTSSDGITWTQRSVFPASTFFDFDIVDPGASPRKILATGGGFWVVALEAGTSGSENIIAYSTDEGVTWRPVWVPQAVAQNATTPFERQPGNVYWRGLTYSTNRRQFAMCATDVLSGGDGASWVATSLAGTPRFEIIADDYADPTVP